MIHRLPVALIASYLLIPLANSSAQTRLEAEDMVLETLRIEGLDTASGGQIANMKGPGVIGSASSEFPGATATYDVFVGYHDENDGAAQLSVSIDGDAVDSWTLDELIPSSRQPNAENFRIRQVASGIRVSQGDVIDIDVLQVNWDHASIDYIEFVPAAEPEETAAVVVVAPSGGDYDNPVTALENLSEGDRWCREPTGATDSRFCVVKIEAGDYVLESTLTIPVNTSILGEGMEVTKLVSAPGLEVAALFSGSENSLLRGVTLQNSSGNGSSSIAARFFEAGSTLSLDSVTLSASGSEQNIGLDIDEESEVNLVRSVVSVQGGTRALGLTGSFANIENSEINVSRATMDNIGIQIRSPSFDGGRLIVDGASVIAFRGQRTIGVTAFGDLMRVRVTGSEIQAHSGANSNVGLSTGGVESPAMITHSQIIVDGGSGSNTGISLGAAAAREPNFELENVSSRVTGGENGVALEVSEPSDGGSVMAIRNSVFSARNAAVSNIGVSISRFDSGARVQFEEVRAEGATASFLSSDASTDADIRFTFSYLLGPFVVPAGSEAAYSCAFVVDENNVPYQASCP